MGQTKTWTNNRIEPLSGDPVSGFDCMIATQDKSRMKVLNLKLAVYNV